MADENSQEFLPDLSKVEFPSDQVTLQQIRRDQPDILFSDRELLNTNRRPTHILAIEMMRTEHLLARKAWAKAIGVSDPHPTHDRHEEILFLNEDYMRCGLSQGLKGTLELVRRFENQVSREAKQSQGQSRP